MKNKLTQVRIFTLRGSTIKSESGKFFVSSTGRNTWAGPHKSLHYATAAIALKLSREFTRRNGPLQGSMEPQS